VDSSLVCGLTELWRVLARTQVNSKTRGLRILNQIVKEICGSRQAKLDSRAFIRGFSLHGLGFSRVKRMRGKESGFKPLSARRASR
jgi:hypothetical protein